MEKSRSRFISRYRMLKAVALRQRPSDLERRLRADAERTFTGIPVAPAAAWQMYKRFSQRRCFADCGWLVQYGVHDFTGKEEFHFSLVRQIFAMERWNDEFLQVELCLLHPPSSELRQLKSWSEWSFAFKDIQHFHAFCESTPGLAQLLCDTSNQWRWVVETQKT